jgi:hypothetical protein
MGAGYPPTGAGYPPTGSGYPPTGASNRESNPIQYNIGHVFLLYWLANTGKYNTLAMYWLTNTIHVYCICKPIHALAILCNVLLNQYNTNKLLVLYLIYLSNEENEYQSGITYFFWEIFGLHGMPGEINWNEINKGSASRHTKHLLHVHQRGVL